MRRAVSGYIQVRLDFLLEGAIPQRIRNVAERTGRTMARWTVPSTAVATQGRGRG